MSNLNREAILRTIRLIEKQNDFAVQMSSFLSVSYPRDHIRNRLRLVQYRKEEGFTPEKERDCSTAGCAAGWAVLANCRQLGIKLTDNIYGLEASLAKQALGLNHYQTEELFMMSGLYVTYHSDGVYMQKEHHKEVRLMDWTSPVFSRDHTKFSAFDAMPPRTRKRALINVLRTLHDTGEVRWLEAIEEAIAQEAEHGRERRSEGSARDPDPSIGSAPGGDGGREGQS